MPGEEERPAVTYYGTHGFDEEVGDREFSYVDQAKVEFDNGVRFIVESRPGKITEKAFIPGGDRRGRRDIGSDCDAEEWLFGVLETYFRLGYPAGLEDASPILPRVFGVTDEVPEAP